MLGDLRLRPRIADDLPHHADSPRFVRVLALETANANPGHARNPGSAAHAVATVRPPGSRGTPRRDVLAARQGYETVRVTTGGFWAAELHSAPLQSQARVQGYRRGGGPPSRRGWAAHGPCESDGTSRSLRGSPRTGIAGSVHRVTARGVGRVARRRANVAGFGEARARGRAARRS